MPALKVICGQNSQYTSFLGPKYHDDEALEDVIAYCTQESKTRPELIEGLNVNVNQAALEMDMLSRSFGKDSGLRLRHWVISFSPKEVRRYRNHVWVELRKIAFVAASYYGNDYQIIYAVHTDNTCPHIHFVMNTVNFRTGYKYSGSKADYFAYYNYLSDFLSEQYGMKLELVHN